MRESGERGDCAAARVGSETLRVRVRVKGIVGSYRPAVGLLLMATEITKLSVCDEHTSVTEVN